jgi:hypothetical protein
MAVWVTILRKLAPEFMTDLPQGRTAWDSLGRGSLIWIKLKRSFRCVVSGDAGAGISIAALGMLAAHLGYQHAA